MAKKRVLRKFSREVNKDARSINRAILRNDLGKGVKNFNKDVKKLNKEVEEVEQWVVERRKFFRKLGFLIILIAVLFVISIILMKIAG